METDESMRKGTEDGESLDVGRGESSEGDESSASEEEEEEQTEGQDLAHQVQQFFSELDIDETKQKKRLFKFGFRVPRRKSILPHHLHTVMGSANLRLAKRDTEGALKLCNEVIRQAPQACEPYLTLATVYEELQDEKKLFQILLIAAHLKRTDVELWLKCTALAKKQENFRVALQCISKALTQDPTNIQLLLEKAFFHCKLEENKKAIEVYELVLKSLPPDAKHEYVRIIKEVAVLCHEVENSPKAIEVLGGSLVSHPQQVDEEIINLLAELCLNSKAFDQAYEVITEFYQMLPSSLPAPTMEASVEPRVPVPPSSSSPFPLSSLSAALRISISGEDMETDPVPVLEPQGEQRVKGGQDMVIPETMPIDLRVKLALAMINLGRVVPENLLKPVFSSPEDYGDLFLDVADAYMANGGYTSALPLLSSLVGTREYSQAGVWLKYAECQYMLNDLEGAAISYSTVLSLAPTHTDSRLQLATLYVQMGQADDALLVLESDPNSEKLEERALVPSSDTSLSATAHEEAIQDIASKETRIQDIRLLIHKHRLLCSTGKLEEYVKTGCSLLIFFFRDIYTHPEIKVLVKLKIRKKKTFRSVLASESRKEDEHLLTPEEWLGVFRQTCTGLFKIGTSSSHYKALYFIYCALISTKFTVSKQLERAFLFYSASLSYIMKDYATAFTVLKDFCCEELTNKRLWNFVNLLPVDDFRRKYFLRLCHKHSSTYCMRLLANYAMTSMNASVRFSLTFFEKEFREGGAKDYLLCLCIAIIYTNMGSQIKNPPNRNATTSMAAGFLHTYLKLRGECQESMYNLGRAFHQMGIAHLACHFYKKVLILEPECKVPEWRAASDLCGEAAFNLSLIYRASGNKSLAIDLLHRYCSV